MCGGSTVRMDVTRSPKLPRQQRHLCVTEEEMLIQSEVFGREADVNEQEVVDKVIARMLHRSSAQRRTRGKRRTLSDKPHWSDWILGDSDDEFPTWFDEIMDDDDDIEWISDSGRYGREVVAVRFWRPVRGAGLNWWRRRRGLARNSSRNGIDGQVLLLLYVTKTEHWTTRISSTTAAERDHWQARHVPDQFKISRAEGICDGYVRKDRFETSNGKTSPEMYDSFDSEEEEENFGGDKISDKHGMCETSSVEEVSDMHDSFESDEDEASGMTRLPATNTRHRTTSSGGTARMTKTRHWTNSGARRISSRLLALRGLPTGTTRLITTKWCIERRGWVGNFWRMRGSLVTTRLSAAKTRYLTTRIISKLLTTRELLGTRRDASVQNYSRRDYLSRIGWGMTTTRMSINMMMLQKIKTTWLDATRFLIGMQAGATV